MFEKECLNCQENTRSEFCDKCIEKITTNELLEEKLASLPNREKITSLSFQKYL
jgi:hypothetical protein